MLTAKSNRKIEQVCIDQSGGRRVRFCCEFSASHPGSHNSVWVVIEIMSVEVYRCIVFQAQARHAVVDHAYPVDVK